MITYMNSDRLSRLGYSVCFREGKTRQGLLLLDMNVSLHHQSVFCWLIQLVVLGAPWVSTEILGCARARLWRLLALLLAVYAMNVCLFIIWLAC